MRLLVAIVSLVLDPRRRDVEPAGSDVAVAAFKSAMTGMNAAYDNMSKSAKQFADLTHANVEAAASQAINPGKKKAA